MKDAAEGGQYELVKLLVASGADMNVYDNIGRLPLQCCIQRKRKDWELTARFLRDAAFRSAELSNVPGVSEPSSVLGVSELGSVYDAYNLEMRVEYDKTPLISACELGDLPEVKDLVKCGALLSAQDIFGETGLHYAAENGHYEVVQVLVRAGADMEILDDDGRTPLDCSVQQKRGQWPEVSRFLSDPEFRREALERLSAAEAAAAEQRNQSAFFWIDALCINQADLDERSSQVRIMPDIYTKASCVIVWLGMPTGKPDDLKDIIRSVSKKDKQLKELEDQWLVPLRDSREDLQVVFGYFTRAWFTRAWCIQELSLARKIKMYLGAHEFHWSDVLKFLCLMSHVGFFRGSNFWKIDEGWRTPDGKGGDTSEAWRLAEIRLRTANDANEWDLVEPILGHKNCKAPHVRRHGRLSLPLLIAATWSFESKDPRDKIYAILSLAKPLSPEDEIVIDYTSPVEKLYTKVAHIFLRGSGFDSMYERDGALAGILEPLEGLSYVQAPYFGGQVAKMPGLPTWVPDFSNPLATNRIWRRAFQAANTIEPTFSPGPVDGTFQTLGLELDVVDMVEPACAVLDIEDIPSDFEINVESWLRLLEQMTPQDGESPVQMLFRTLTMDGLWKDCDEETRTRNAESFRDFMAWELARLNEHYNDSSFVGDFSESGSDSEYEYSDESGSDDDATPGTEVELDEGQPAEDEPAEDEPAEDKPAENEPREEQSSMRDGDETDGAATNADTKHTKIDLGTLFTQNARFSRALARQRTFEKTHNPVSNRRFLPSDDEIPAIKELGGWWCNFHGQSCEELENENSFRFQMVSVYRKRCLFRTKGGRLGLGPQYVRPGDVVWLIAGSRTPYVLKRKTPEQEEEDQEEGKEEGGEGKEMPRFRFLGEAYIHGVMYGEALTEKTKADFTTIHLE